jgi:hypothetical protein
MWTTEFHQMQVGKNVSKKNRNRGTRLEYQNEGQLVGKIEIILRGPRGLDKEEIVHLTMKDLGKTYFQPEVEVL